MKHLIDVLIVLGVWAVAIAPVYGLIHLLAYFGEPQSMWLIGLFKGSV